MTGREKLKLLTDFYNATHILKLQSYTGEDAPKALLEMKHILQSMNMAGLRVPDPINTNWLKVGQGKVHKGYGTVVCISPHGYSYVLNDTRYNVLQLDFENVMCDCAQYGLDRFFEVLKNGELKDGAELIKGNLILRPSDDFKFPSTAMSTYDGVTKADMALAHVELYNALFNVAYCKNGVIVSGDNIGNFSDAELNEIAGIITPTVMDLNDSALRTLHSMNCIKTAEKHVICYYPTFERVGLYRMRIDDSVIPMVLVGNKLLIHGSDAMLGFAEFIINKGTAFEDDSMPSILLRLQHLDAKADFISAEYDTRALLKNTTK